MVFLLFSGPLFFNVSRKTRNIPLISHRNRNISSLLQSQNTNTQGNVSDKASVTSSSIPFIVFFGIVIHITLFFLLHVIILHLLFCFLLWQTLLKSSKLYLLSYTLYISTLITLFFQLSLTVNVCLSLFFLILGI